MNWRDGIKVDPDVCHGRACVAGTRVFVTTILDNLAAGRSPEDIVRDYPSVTRAGVLAAVGYAAALAHEREARRRRPGLGP